jgi:hypothetical protein
MDTWQLIVGISGVIGVIIALIVLLFGDKIFFRIKSYFRRQIGASTMQNPNATCDLLRDTQNFVIEANKRLPQNPPIVTQDIAIVRDSLQNARSKVQQAMTNTNPSQQLHLVLDAMVNPSAKHSDTNFHRALAVCFTLQSYAQEDAPNVKHVADELFLLQGLIGQIQGKIEKLLEENCKAKNP